MWAKILAGVVAAVAVGGTGTFFAVHGTCGQSSTESAAVESPCGCCLMAPDAGACPGDTNPSDAMAACVGPTAFLPTATCQKPAGACCTE